MQGRSSDLSILTRQMRNAETVSFLYSLTPDCPQSEIAATIFYDSGGDLDEGFGEESGEVFGAFSCFF